MPTKKVEWKHNIKTLIQAQVPLVLSWTITIHKYQLLTLELVEIYLGTSEKCCGMSLVALSCVKNLNNTLFKLFSYEILIKINNSKQ